MALNWIKSFKLEITEVFFVGWLNETGFIVAVDLFDSDCRIVNYLRLAAVN